MKQVITQWIIIPCNNSYKDYHKALAKRSLKTLLSKPTTKWRKRPLTSLHCSASSMHYTNNHQGITHQGPTSKPLGKHEDNISKITRTHNHWGKDLGSLHSTWPPPQSHGTISQFLWILTKPEHLEGTGEEGEGDHHEEMLHEQKMLELKEGYRVCALIVENKDISLTIVLQSRNEPTPEQCNSLTGAQKTMKVTQGQQQSIPCTNNWMHCQRKTKKS